LLSSTHPPNAIARIDEWSALYVLTQSRIVLQCPHHPGDWRPIVRAMGGAHDAPSRMGLSPDAVRLQKQRATVQKPQNDRRPILLVLTVTSCLYG
jgi:hypothetical protein